MSKNIGTIVYFLVGVLDFYASTITPFNFLNVLCFVYGVALFYKVYDNLKGE